MENSITKHIDLLLNNHQIKRDRVTDEADIMTDLGLSTYQFKRLITTLEGKFQLSIPHQEWRSYSKVKHLKNHVSTFLV
jgi:acyl carrier protein